MVDLPSDYRPSKDEPFMNDMQKEYFRRRLLEWREQLLKETEDTIDNLKEGGLAAADVADRASAEAD